MVLFIFVSSCHDSYYTLLKIYNTNDFLITNTVNKTKYILNMAGVILEPRNSNETWHFQY